MTSTLSPAAAAKGTAEYRNFIDGAFVASRGTRTVPNTNPADTSEVLGVVRLAGRDETRAAIDAAEAAQRRWRKVPAPERGRVLARAREVLGRRAGELAEALTREEGKLLREAKGEIQKSLNMLEFMAGEGLRFGGRTRASELPSNFCYTLRQPIGVVGIITPWNFPVCIPLWKIAPALVAGNAVVFKPATLTPWCAEIICEAFQEAGLPPGVLNMVIGSGGEVGDEMVANKKVRALSFTGSNEVGTRLYAQAALGLKKVQCEMGGKNPLVILEDADLELAAAACAQGAFGSTGQRCTATSRAVVIDKVADRFVELVKGHAEKLVVGNPLDPKTDMGPAVDEGQFEVDLRYIAVARDEDKATLVTGGKRSSRPGCERGWFVEPTIFDDVQPAMRLAREEVFGPVLAVLRVKDFDEAVRVANDVDFGLTSSIYTRDAARWYRFVDEIETGITHLNSPTMGGEPQMPFGGVKATGIGAREMGEAGVEFFTEEKAVYVDYTGTKREGNLY